MTKNTYNPYEIMMDKYDKEEMLSDVREAMLYQLGVDVSCEELNHFFTGKGKAALSGCAEWQQCFAVEKMLEFYYVHARDETLAKQIETMTMSFPETPPRGQQRPSPTTSPSVSSPVRSWTPFSQWWSRMRCGVTSSRRN